MMCLKEANLNDTNLGGADLSETNLFRVWLRRADLSRANLSGATLEEAGHFQADLNEANLNGTIFEGVYLDETILADLNLATVKGLESCNHFGPNIIDHRTLMKSGRLPPTFLRECGLPDSLIDYLPSLLSEAIQFYKCFISYSHKDEEFVKRLHADLQDNGVRCWYGAKDMRAGKKIHLQIDEAIRFHDKLLLVLSEYSINSTWVATEIRKARKRERQEGKQMLFPVRLVSFESIRNWELFDSDAGRDLAAEVREYFIPDFSNWENHDDYQMAFNRLLRDLKQE